MFWLITIYGYNICDDKKRREKKKTLEESFYILLKLI